MDLSFLQNDVQPEPLPPLADGSTTGQFEVLSPSVGSISGRSDGGSTATSTPAAFNDDEEYSEAPKKGGKKRKSDVIDASLDIEGTRKSARKRRS